jgi:hypothetical protein
MTRTAEKMLTMNQVAARMEWSLRTAQRRVAAKELPYVDVAPVGARRASIRVPESALAEYIRRRLNNPDAAPSSPGLVPQRSPAAKPG